MHTPNSHLFCSHSRLRRKAPQAIGKMEPARRCISVRDRIENNGAFLRSELEEVDSIRLGAINNLHPAATKHADQVDHFGDGVHNGGVVIGAIAAPELDDGDEREGDVVGLQNLLHPGASPVERGVVEHS